MLPRCRQPIGNKRATRGTFISRSNTVFATTKIQHNRIKPKRPIKLPKKTKTHCAGFLKQPLFLPTLSSVHKHFLNFPVTEKQKQQGLLSSFPVFIQQNKAKS
jgi:hypothetical protein